MVVVFDDFFLILEVVGRCFVKDSVVVFEGLNSFVVLSMRL